jgi:hypothetical protein
MKPTSHQIKIIKSSIQTMRYIYESERKDIEFDTDKYESLWDVPTWELPEGHIYTMTKIMYDELKRGIDPDIWNKVIVSWNLQLESALQESWHEHR